MKRSSAASSAASIGNAARTTKREVVVGIKQRGGELRFFHAEDVKSGTLAKYIKENVSDDVDVIMTDEWPAYPKAIDSGGNQIRATQDREPSRRRLR